MQNETQHEGAPTTRDLYPSLTEEELKEAAENWAQYLDLALRMYERIRNNAAEYERFRALTERGAESNMNDERSNYQNNQKQQ